MKLFSLKSLCLRWRGELIDNANVPVDLREEGKGKKKGEEWGRGACSSIPLSLNHMQTISMYSKYE